MAKDTADMRHLIWFEDLRREDVALVGGKNSSLGEMVSQLEPLGIKVPPGYATTSDAFRAFITHNDLHNIVADTMKALEEGKIKLAEAGRTVREAIARGDFPEDARKAIVEAYYELGRRVGQDNVSVAVRSSATAEDLPDASFAGQQETYLNVVGEKQLLETCRLCYASLFTDRAITYRTVQGFDHLDVALSIGVQLMVRSDIGGSGVMFSIDTETGFPKSILINAAWGLGENVVQGAVTPDEYQVYKPFLDNPKLMPIIEKKLGAKEIKMIYSENDDDMTKNVPTSKKEKESWVLSDEEIVELARYAKTIEEHYGQPMDMEWARDGVNGGIYIVQARPETVQSRAQAGAMKRFSVKSHGKEIMRGISVGAAVATGTICLIESVKDIDKFIDGSILVTTQTDPDWVPIMKKAKAIITDAGGRTSHAAIVSRELGVPAIVGCGDATHVLHDMQDVTVDCSQGDDGLVYEGFADYAVEELDLSHVPETETKIMLNLANPSTSARWWRLPVDGVGLARMEFVINNAIIAHPLALLHFDKVEKKKDREFIEELTKGYDDKSQFFVDTLARGLSRIAALVYPNKVIVRMSDFKTNEYAELVGGKQFEPKEENPMIGFRGASRYYSESYKEAFGLECKAIKRLREDMGFDNVTIMIPFCRSLDEADKVLEVLGEYGLVRGEGGLEIYVMCEIPANVILAEQFADRFDGFSIGSNDLTQLTLGVDRDSGTLADLFEESNEAVEWMISTVIEKAHKTNSYVGLCGQAPSNDPTFAKFLVQAGIDTISVTPDSFLAVKENVAEAEKARKG
ncbi:phosphoenolpyruvate synthase [Sinisalibacter aestuarii]|uniref:Phosphoenolpyruvate synthase n=1 Tax=Sinisalibacter aestuarii TaxID=2949426 RepID=A0ABQ5LVF4_9RHOB|nr:phosphoenolpyruvate synthase [Sinisalibacter aestuarii]GKY88578.1 phosphoenolpyruvate synthase [Sinisalibacter aestuarii]